MTDRVTRARRDFGRRLDARTRRGTRRKLDVVAELRPRGHLLPAAFGEYAAAPRWGRSPSRRDLHSTDRCGVRPPARTDGTRALVPPHNTVAPSAASTRSRARAERDVMYQKAHHRSPGET